jgi:hypothetical protein
MGGNVADATLLGQTPLPMRSWFPPFAKCAKDEADLVIGGDSRSKAGAPAIPPPHQDQNPRPVSAKNADTRTGHPPPETDAGGKIKPTQVVVEPDKAAETPLGMTPWSATGQGHDRDEAAGRGDPAVLDTVSLYMTDKKEAVKYTAAAAVLRLTAIKESGAEVKKKGLRKKSKK